MAQEWAKAFYSSTLWVKTRGYILKRDRYVCQRCGRPATVVHHKVHLTKDNIKNKNISLGPANLESLCDDCHRIEHEEVKWVKSAFRSGRSMEAAQTNMPHCPIS